MIDVLDNISKFAQNSLQRVKVRSALNPIIWMSAVISVICFTFAYLFKEMYFICFLLIIVGILPIIIGCIAFIYFSIAKTEKLQSEDYQIRYEALQIIRKKGGKVILDTTSLNAIANPEFKQLNKGDNN